MKLNKLRYIYSVHLFFHYLPLGLFFPISTLFLLDKGFSLGWIGSAMSVYSITVLMLELPTGGFADKWGRITTFRISRVFYILGLSLLLLSKNLFMLFISMFFYGISRALCSGAMEAWFVDMHENTREDELQKSMAQTGFVATTGLGISTLLGGWLPDFAAKQNLPMEKYSLNILLGIFVVLLHLLFHGIFISKDQPKNDSSNFTSFVHNLSGLLKKSNTLKYLLALSFVLGLGISTVEGFWQPRTIQIQPDSSSLILGILASVYFFAAAVGSLLSTRLVKLMGQEVTLIVLKMLHGIALISLGAWNSTYGFAVGFAIMFIFHGALSIPHQALLHKSIPSSYRSSLLSVDSLAMMAGAGIASVVSGWLAQSFSIPFIWGISGSFILVSAFLYVPIKLDERKKNGKRNKLNEPSV